jgi:putative DNA primase/helicase
MALRHLTEDEEAQYQRLVEQVKEKAEPVQESGVVSLLQKCGQNRLPEPQPGMIPFQNGLLDFLSGELIAATPRNASTWILPFDYEKNAHCPHFLGWLKTAVDADKDTIMLLRAWINALLTGRPDLQVFLHLIGPAGTGKSTFGRVVLVLVGDENATTTSLKQLETNRFETANIFGKRLTAIEEANKFGGSVSVPKAMTGQDPLRLERKNQQQQGSFIYGGQTLMMSNERLATTDYTSCIERRRIPLKHCGF